MLQIESKVHSVGSVPFSAAETYRLDDSDAQSMASDAPRLRLQKGELYKSATTRAAAVSAAETAKASERSPASSQASGGHFLCKYQTISRHIHGGDIFLVQG